MNDFEQCKLIRLKEVLQIIPVGKSTWWSKVNSGEFPQSYQLTERITVWKFCEIVDLVNKLENTKKIN